MERAITQDEWYGVQSVGCVRAMRGRIKHLLSIPMISRDHSPAIKVLDFLNKTPYSGIKRLNRPHCGRKIPRMPHHVNVREVKDDSINLSCAQMGQRRLSDFVRAHLRLQIIGRYFWRRDKHTVFSGKRRFHAPVEEI